MNVSFLVPVPSYCYQKHAAMDSDTIHPIRGFSVGISQSVFLKQWQTIGAQNSDPKSQKAAESSFSVTTASISSPPWTSRLYLLPLFCSSALLLVSCLFHSSSLFFSLCILCLSLPTFSLLVCGMVFLDEDLWNTNLIMFGTLVASDSEPLRSTRSVPYF